MFLSTKQLSIATQNKTETFYVVVNQITFQFCLSGYLKIMLKFNKS
ncbi:hypothetical protein BVRB_4g080090 [Beta vulgaris subsp. vulgaris]|nr:hypothetical protein BVRB_4g080090 [Beta vulgaris subsp. vulgaris]